MLFFSPPMQFNLNAAGAGGAVPITYWLAGAYDGAGTENVFPADLEVDSTGNIYILSTMSSATYGTANSGFVLSKLNASGEFQWHKILDGAQGGNDGAAAGSKGGALAIDGDDNIIVAQTGKDRGAISVNTGFVIKISPAGSIIWQQVQDPGNSIKETRTYGVVVDKSTNDVYVTGETNSITALGTFGTYVIKYNSSGTQQWMSAFGVTGNDAGHALRLDSNGDVLVSGATTSGALRGMVAKLSKSTGAISWSRYVGNTTNNKSFADMAIDGDDPVMVGWNSQNSSGSNDLWVVKYNNSGTYQWGRLLGGSANDQGYAIATDDSGNVYVSGFQSSDVAHTSVTQTLELAKYNSSGTIQWQKRFTADNNSLNTNQIVGMRFHPDGSLIFCIFSGNGIGPTYSIQVMKLPADDTLWPSTIGDWSIATSSVTDKAAATTQGTISFTTATSGISATAGTYLLSDPSATFTEAKTDITI